MKIRCVIIWGIECPLEIIHAEIKISNNVGKYIAQNKILLFHLIRDRNWELKISATKAKGVQLPSEWSHFIGSVCYEKPMEVTTVYNVLLTWTLPFANL